MALVVVALLTVPYLVGVVVRRRRRECRWPWWRTASFLSGSLARGTAFAPAVRELAEHDFRGHVLQHLVIGMYAPIALALGSPVTLLLASVPSRVARRVTGVLRTRAFHALAHPVTTALLAVGGMYVLYLTPLLAATEDQPALHRLMHAHFLLAGYLFAWSIMGPDPAPRRPGLVLRLVVLVLAGGAHAYLSKMLFARADALSATLGQIRVESGAQLMYYGGDLAEVALAVGLMAAWYRGRFGSRSTSRRGRSNGGRLLLDRSGGGSHPPMRTGSDRRTSRDPSGQCGRPAGRLTAWAERLGGSLSPICFAPHASVTGGRS